MAEDLVKSLRSSVVSAADKLPLARAAYANPHLYVPRKADLLTDWAVNTIFKSRGWSNQDYGQTPILWPEYWSFLAQLVADPDLAFSTLKSPVFGLLASATSHILTALPNRPEHREILLTHVASCFTTLAGRLRTSQKITLDAWADLVKAIAAHPPSPAAVALGRAVLEAFIAVLGAYPVATKAMAATASALHALLALPTELQPLVCKALEIGLFAPEIASSMYTAASKVTVDVLLAKEDPDGPSAVKRAKIEVDPKKNKHKRGKKKQGDEAGDGPGIPPFAGVVPDELAVALQGTAEADVGRTYATVLDVALSALAQMQPSTLVQPPAANSAPGLNASAGGAPTASLVYFAVYRAIRSLSPVATSFRFTNRLFAVLAPRLSLTDDRQDVLNRAIRGLLSDTPPGPSEALDRFVLAAQISVKPVVLHLPKYVDMLVDLAGTKDNWDRAADILVQLIQVFGQARMLNILFQDLGRVVLKPAPGKLSILLARTSTLELFVSHVTSGPHSARLDIADQLVAGLVKSPDRVLATYLAALLRAAPRSDSVHTSALEKTLRPLLSHAPLSPAILHVHVAAMAHVPEYARAWTKDSARLVGLVTAAAKEFTWMALPALVQAMGHVPEASLAEVQALAATVVARGVTRNGGQAVDVHATWSGAFWDLAAAPHQAVYWWMTVVDHLDVLPIIIGQHEGVSQALEQVANLLTQSIADEMPNLDEHAPISMVSVSTQALLSAQFYEIAWMRPFVASMFIEAKDQQLVLRKANILALFPAEYFTPAERSVLAQKLVSAAINGNEAWDPVVVRVALALDLPVNPTSLDQAMANASFASPDLILRLAYKLTLRLLQQTDSPSDRKLLVSDLLTRPQFQADPYFALRVVLEWVGAERGHARNRPDLVFQVVADLPDFAPADPNTPAVDPVRAAFMYLLARFASGKNATSTATHLSHFSQHTLAWLGHALQGTVEPLVVRALEVYLAKLDADADSAFTTLYAALLNDHPVSHPDQVANWLALVHTMSAIAKHERSVRKLLRQVLLRLEQLVEHITRLPDLLALLSLMERLLERVPRLSTRSLSHFQLLLSTLLGQSFAARFFAHVPLAQWSKHDRESVFLAVADVLAAMLHHQRHALVHAPVMFTVILRDLIQCFLEPGRYAQKHLAASSAATTPAATADNAADALAVSRLPLALLTSLAPLPASCAWAWHRLIQGIGTLTTAVLVTLQGMPSSKVIEPIAMHLPALVAEFMQWHAFTVHAGHPRFGWAIVVDAKVRAALMRGVYEAMDLVGEQGRARVLAMVPAQGKGAYKEVVGEYEKYHQFKGKV